jgi:uncharacterized protein HemX
MLNVHAGSLMMGVLLGALAAGAGLYAWLARRARQVQERLLRVEHARAQGAQQLTQARKQIEQLQLECRALRLAVRPAQRPAPAAERAPEEESAEARRRRAEALLNAADEAAKAAPPPTFQDTVLLVPRDLG